MDIADADAENKFRVDLRVLADFVSVASKLIFLKSKYFLPGLALTEEEEADIKDLEVTLNIYQQLKPAIKLINQLWQTSHHSYSRPYFIGQRHRDYSRASHVLSGNQLEYGSADRSARRYF